MVECGDADAQWLLGILEDIRHPLKKVVKVVDARPGEIMFGLEHDYK